jgi:formate dehydrogenase
MQLRNRGPVEITDAMMSGHISLPNGQGVDYPAAAALAGTPWHKHVPARLEPIPSA